MVNEKLTLPFDVYLPPNTVDNRNMIIYKLANAIPDVNTEVFLQGFFKVHSNQVTPINLIQITENNKVCIFVLNLYIYSLYGLDIKLTCYINDVVTENQNIYSIIGSETELNNIQNTTILTLNNQDVVKFKITPLDNTLNYTITTNTNIILV